MIQEEGQSNRGYEAKEPYKSYEYSITTDFTCNMLDDFDIDSVILTKEGTCKYGRSGV